MDINEKLKEVCERFRIEGTYVGHEMIQVGNVNKTYEVKFILPNGQPKSFLVQNVNTYAFRHPVELMDNIDKVTEHIRAKKPGQIALHFHHTADRKTYVIDGDNFWRMTNFIPSVTHGVVQDMEIIRSAGKAFGEFQMDLADFSPEDLFETIPGFHNTRGRYAALKASVAADPVGRVAEVREELEYLLSVEDEACKLIDMLQTGELPLRVTHNDTKLNNVLLDRDTRKSLCVLDLDTVMPGLSLYDFGDSIRFGAATAAEDEKDLSKVTMSLDMFRIFTEGFLTACTTLTDKELEMMPMGAKTMTMECGVRFLTDYLDGDHYFAVHREGHNLDRCRTQFKLVQDMEQQFDAMAAIVRKYA